MSIESFAEKHWMEEAAIAGTLVAGGLAAKFLPEIFGGAADVSEADTEAMLRTSTSITAETRAAAC